MATKTIDLFDFGDVEASKSQNNPKTDDDFADFGEFVSTGVPKSEPATPANSIDLFSLDSVPQMPAIVPQKPQNDVDNLFSISSNQQPSTGQDLLSVFSDTPTQIQNSFTMPNISLGQNWNQNLVTPTNQPAPVRSSETAKKVTNTNSIWDKLGQSVDINLDNLTPHSKGLSNKGNQNSVPLKDLMGQSIQSPKLIPNSSVSPNSISANSGKSVQINSNNNANLFDF